MGVAPDLKSLGRQLEFRLPVGLVMERNSVPGQAPASDIVHREFRGS
jgi:hypothetical protein